MNRRRTTDGPARRSRNPLSAEEGEPWKTRKSRKKTFGFCSEMGGVSSVQSCFHRDKPGGDKGMLDHRVHFMSHFFLSATSA